MYRFISFLFYLPLSLSSLLFLSQPCAASEKNILVVLPEEYYKNTYRMEVIKTYLRSIGREAKGVIDYLPVSREESSGKWQLTPKKIVLQNHDQESLFHAQYAIFFFIIPAEVTFQRKEDGVLDHCSLIPSSDRSDQVFAIYYDVWNQICPEQSCSESEEHLFFLFAKPKGSRKRQHTFLKHFAALFPTFQEDKGGQSVHYSLMHASGPKENESSATKEAMRKIRGPLSCALIPPVEHVAHLDHIDPMPTEVVRSGVDRSLPIAAPCDEIQEAGNWAHSDDLSPPSLALPSTSQRVSASSKSVPFARRSPKLPSRRRSSHVQSTGGKKIYPLSKRKKQKLDVGEAEAPTILPMLFVLSGLIGLGVLFYCSDEEQEKSAEEESDLH